MGSGMHAPASPSQELRSLGSLVARKTTLTRVALFRDKKSKVFYPEWLLFTIGGECCCERTRTGTVSSAQMLQAQCR